MKLLYTLIILSAFSFPSEKYYKYTKLKGFNFGMDMGYVNQGGLMFSLNGYDVDMKENLLMGLFFLINTDDRLNGYENYTDHFGTVNVYGDRYDGTISIHNYESYGIMSRKILINREFIFLLGISNNKTDYYESYYDAYEILGNNGKYFIDSNKNSEKAMGLTLGIKYNHYPFKIQYIRNVDFFFSIGIIAETNSMNSYISPIITLKS